MKKRTMIGIGVIAALGIGAYLLLKKGFGITGGIGAAIAGAPAAVTVAMGAAPETIQETGAIGGAGDILYKLAYGGDLREEATQAGGLYYERAKAEIPKVTGVTPTPEMIVPRAVAMGVAEEMHEGEQPMAEAMLLAPWTIGAGLGAITQQQRYYEALPTPEAKKAAVVQEYETRQEWIREHPLESMIGFPAGIIHAVTTPVPQTDFFSTLARGWGRIFG